MLYTNGHELHRRLGVLRKAHIVMISLDTLDLGKADASAVAVEDMLDTTRIFAQPNFNGDGIIPAEAAADEAIRAVIADIMACLGSETDRSGKPGVNQAKVDEFFVQAQAYSDWRKKAVL